MIELFPRKCSQTGEGMYEGWVAYDGAAYFKYAKDAVAWIIEEETCECGVLDPKTNDAERIEMYTNYSHDDWLEFAFNHDMLYWTTWECELDDEINYLADGTEIHCTKN